jgi:hypothetical protein
MYRLILLFFLIIAACSKDPRSVVIPQDLRDRYYDKEFTQAVNDLNYQERVLLHQFLGMWAASGEKRFPDNFTIGNAIDAHVECLSRASTKLGKVSHGTSK